MIHDCANVYDCATGLASLAIVREFTEGSERAVVCMRGTNWNLRVWSSYLASEFFGSVLNDRLRLISKKLIFTIF